MPGSNALRHDINGAPYRTTENDYGGIPQRVYICDNCRWRTYHQGNLSEESPYENGWLCPSCIESIRLENEEHDYDSYCECATCRDYRQDMREEDRRDRLGDYIQEYDYIPDPIFLRTSRESKILLKAGRYEEDRTPYLAFELEIENVEEDISRLVMAEQVKRPWNYLKEDGSLDDGFEIVSHPFTWDYFNSQKMDWRDVLGECQDAGFRSFETNTAGMHVHISKAAFSSYHLYRFLRLFYASKAFTYWLSRRPSQTDFDEWAPFVSKDVDPDREPTMSRKAKDKFYPSKYETVNLAHAGSVEIRIFKGTLHRGSFLRNMEIVYSAYQYTTPSSNSKTRDIGPQGFAEFILANRKQFPQCYKAFWQNGHTVPEIEREYR